MWQFQNFSVTNILPEIDSGHFEATKTAVLTIWVALICEFLKIMDIFKCEIFPKIKIQNLQNCKNNTFWPLEISQALFHVYT